MFEKLKLNKTIASMKLNRFVKDLENSIGKKLLHDAIIMEAYVDIINGDTIIHGKNSVVDQGLIGIINYLSGHTVTSPYQLASYNWGGRSTYMVIGSDTTHTTSHGTALLTAPTGGAQPGTIPNTQSGSTYGPPTTSLGTFQIQWTATWNATTVSGTLGEVGLYLQLMGGPTLAGFNVTSSQSVALFSRMASADGKFTAFTINNVVPLSIAWTFQLTYAT